jgi:thiol-disulfide isomerase/thioredoxin
VAVALALVGIGLAVVSHPDPAPNRPEPDRSPTSMPDTRYTLLAGSTSSLRDHQGTPMVINFWYSTCPPCRLEMPAIESVHEQVGDQVAFVGLAVKDDPDGARSFVSETGVTYEIGLDPSGELALRFGIFLMPTTFFIDAGGHIVNQHTGTLTGDTLRSLLATTFGVRAAR